MNNDFYPTPDQSAEEQCAVQEVPPMPDLRRERLQFSSIAFGISFIVLFTTVVQMLISTVIATLDPSIMDRDWYLTVMSTAPMYAVAMPLSLLLFRIGRADPPKRKHLSPIVWLGLLAICFALTYAGNFIGIFVNAVIGAVTGEMPVNDIQELTMNTPLWANLVFCGILAPIMEEIFYRKLVIDRMRRYGDVTAILISGVLFGLIHGNFSQFFYASFVGILFGYVYLNTGKLRYTVGLHMAINLVGGVYATEMAKRLDMEMLSADPILFLVNNRGAVMMLMLYMLFIIACVVTAPIAIALLWKHIRFRKPKIQLTPKQFLRAVLLNPPVWLLLGVIVLLFAL